ncbi:taurine catabolism dioxygenase [Fistulina hepatica ATCC 64428]|uniref:Taurine catabolism dioxygenase n=1 Tax=Fistulina hepatica ATCC 64428 TaxID=1128425 RepID=A0A0D7ARE6_9AGAR|nr:taurine catabolism dioxygenase [Fistulina hepatica ATCC 64428]
MPSFSPEPLPPLLPFEHVDPGFRALKHANPRAFLDGATSIVDFTPRLGTEIRGINLAKLDSDGRDQLALEVAKRGVMVFRDQQEFIDSPPEFWQGWGRHFGRLHDHPTLAHVKGHTEFHIVYRDERFGATDLANKISSIGWHSDISFELQPPGLTTFFLLDQPPSGGDTLFQSSGAVLKRLSPTFVNFLRTLKAENSSVEQAATVKGYKLPERRPPSNNIHPVVRRHPVTAEEVLYVNPVFTKRIVGLKKEESESLLKFLFDVINKSGDTQTRLRWQPYTVAIWDNRVTNHSIVVDFENMPGRRHGLRITPQAERPIPASDGLKMDE